ncbi:hypothetical protein [Alkalicoccus urumqiensis]|uniref:Uncharacterized protein n=1 Tax=Alkalicoccus urumqiensis TaxID=1548213 RepID=A0A2P6MGH7_ALKUR|nr:hypothetical protein [Alkalicoccus urumqiensis]PRO65386.1 hypothetical protein C6I21_09490 [Alkalicoccus urumqiensis]
MIDKQDVVEVRRTFDWAGAQGIELMTSSHQVFAPTWKQAKVELENLCGTKDSRLWRIQPPMSMEEAEHIDRMLLEWADAESREKA